MTFTYEGSAHRFGMPESRYLFVYGTLRAAAGTEWSKFLASASRFAGAGRAHGALFQLDGYPGMTACTDGDAWVCGEVYLLNDPSLSWPTLDAYEGCGPVDRLPHEFERQVVTVVLNDGQAIEAWAYIYTLQTQGRARIASGDYLQANHVEDQSRRVDIKAVGG
jgi:gamma-glutamylcyclotransferase (GGCT)/AIG2-like uncharacterized protein YtfP